MNVLKHTCQFCYREIVSLHTKCSEEQGRRLSNDLCLVCREPMNNEVNIEHALCKGKQYIGYQELVNDDTTDYTPDDITLPNPYDIADKLPDDITFPNPYDIADKLPDDITGDKVYSRPRDVQTVNDAKTDSRIYAGSTVSVEQATNSGMLLIDTRIKYEYDEGHIPGAVNMPLKDLLADETPLAVSIEAVKAGIGNNTKTVIYDNSFGAVASRVAWTLERAGLERAWLLDVTYKGWLESGGKPSVEAVVPSTSAVFTPVENKDIYASIDDVESADDNLFLVDNRERLNFLEKHIPGATNIPYHMLAEGERVLKDPKDLRRLFDNRGIDEKTKIITYCGSAGTLSGLMFYALRHAGFDNQRLYSKSLREWNASEKPTETQPDAAYWDLSAE